MSEHSMFTHAILEKGFIPLMATQGLYSMLAVLRTDITNTYIGLDSSNYNICKKIYNKDEYQLKSTMICNKANEVKAQVALNANLVDEQITIDEFERDQNGLIDRKKLYYIINTQDDDEFIELETETEKQIASIWAEILNVNKIGKNSNFFSLGGHSLNVTRLVARVKQMFGVKIQVKDIFQQALLGKLAAKVEQLQKNGVEKEEQIETVKKEQYELSYAQKRVFLLENLEKQRGLYTIVSAWSMKGNINMEILEKSMDIIVKRHEMLRTTFNTIEGEPVQIVHDEMKIPFAVSNLKGLPQNMIEQKIEEMIQLECMRQYDLVNGPLMYCSILKKEEDDIIFIIGQHHIISDGWSFGILVEELNEIYAALLEGKELDLSPIDVPVVNYVEWKNKKVLEDVAEKEYWMDKLKGNLEVLDLPVDYLRNEIQTYNGETMSFDLNKSEKDKLDAFGKSNSCTLFMTMLSAYYLLLHKLTSQNNIIVGIPVSGREDDITKNMIGMFVNSLAVKNEIDERSTLMQFVEQVKSSVLEVFNHQEYPFDKLVDDINPVRDIGHTPIFQTMFNYLNVSLKPEINGVETEEYIVHRKVSKFDMSVNILDLGDTLNVSFEYNADLFESDTINRWMNYYFNILKQLINSPEVVISDMNIMSEKEYKDILSVNDNATEYPKCESLGEVFAETVQLYPDKLAVEYYGRTLTYKELHEMSDALAYDLSEKGVKPGDNVAIDVERHIETIVGVLAIIKCGAAYVPINKKYPKNIIEHMLQDCEVKYLLTENADRKVLDIESVDLKAKYEKHDFQCVRGSEHNAYVIYTSGSTGIPKGVIVNHKNILRLVKNASWIELEENDVILQTGALSFDASTFEIWGALLNGLKLVIVDDDCILDTEKLKEKIVENKVTIMWVSAPLFNQLVESDSNVFTGCKTLLVGGDVLSVKHVNIVLQSCPEITILNGYGPTENTTFSTIFKIDKEYQDNIPIGKPISNSSVYVVNKNMKLQPIGVVGELLVGGDGVAEGYLHNEELTKSRFIDNPFESDKKAYRTGDYVRMLKDGNIQFIGRIDNQVKVRGFRIELDAIKNVILRHEKVNDCVVTVQENQENKLVAAYVTADETVSKMEILDYLKKNIADYMIPSKIVVVQEIPLNTNGKVDMTRLSLIEDMKKEEILPVEEAVNETERIILEEYRSVLRNNQFGVNDSFFEWGGDSLLTIKLSSRLKTLGYHVDPKLIFMYQTVRELAAELSNFEEITVKEKKPQDYLIQIHKGDENEPKIFFMPPAGGTILGYIELSRHFKTLGSAYGVQAPGLYDDEQPQYLSFDEMVDFCMQAIRDIYNPEKDYIAGHSLGGHFAYAMCHKFVKQGVKPRGLLILDTVPYLDEIAETQNQDVNEEEFKIFVLTMGIGNMINGDTKRFENMSYDQIKEEIIRMSKTDETIASFMNEDYLDKYLKMQLHHILLSREVKLPKEKIALPIDVIRTTAHEERVKELFNDWKQFSSEEVCIYDFEANHTSMMKLPCVVNLAKLIEKIIKH